MTRHKPGVYDRHLPRGFGNLPRCIPITQGTLLVKLLPTIYQYHPAENMLL
jgi:hypothetical protein